MKFAILLTTNSPNLSSVEDIFELENLPHSA